MQKVREGLRSIPDPLKKCFSTYIYIYILFFAVLILAGSWAGQILGRTDLVLRGGESGWWVGAAGRLNGLRLFDLLNWLWLSDLSDGLSLFDLLNDFDYSMFPIDFEWPSNVQNVERPWSFAVLDRLRSHSGTPRFSASKVLRLWDSKIRIFSEFNNLRILKS